MECFTPTGPILLSSIWSVLDGVWWLETVGARRGREVAKERLVCPISARGRKKTTVFVSCNIACPRCRPQKDALWNLTQVAHTLSYDEVLARPQQKTNLNPSHNSPGSEDQNCELGTISQPRFFMHPALIAIPIPKYRANPTKKLGRGALLCKLTVEVETKAWWKSTCWNLHDQENVSPRQTATATATATATRTTLAGGDGGNVVRFLDIDRRRGEVP